MKPHPGRVAVPRATVGQRGHLLLLSMSIHLHHHFGGGKSLNTINLKDFCILFNCIKDMSFQFITHEAVESYHRQFSGYTHAVICVKKTSYISNINQYMNKHSLKGEYGRKRVGCGI